MTTILSKLQKQRDHFEWPARPRWALGRLWCEYNRRVRNRTGIQIMEEDWDNLIILDACRYDCLRDVSTIDGDLSRVLSAAPNTIAFLRQNFADGEFPDTVYVSGHVNLKRIDAKFHDRVRLFETHRETVYPGEFDDRYEVVFPETMTEEAPQTQVEYPNKRLIIHFMQPHTPLIGENAAKEIFDPDEYWYEQLKRGKISREQAEAAYNDTLERTLPAVERLIDGLNGKTVVSADHGELMGERGVYAHPPGQFIEQQVMVPWLEIEGDERKEIVDGEATVGSLQWEVRDDEQLRDLGYLS